MSSTCERADDDVHAIDLPNASMFLTGIFTSHSPGRQPLIASKSPPSTAKALTSVGTAGVENMPSAVRLGERRKFGRSRTRLNTSSRDELMATIPKSATSSRSAELSTFVTTSPRLAWSISPCDRPMYFDRKRAGSPGGTTGPCAAADSPSVTATSEAIKAVASRWRFTTRVLPNMVDLRRMVSFGEYMESAHYWRPKFVGGVQDRVERLHRRRPKMCEDQREHVARGVFADDAIDVAVVRDHDTVIVLWAIHLRERVECGERARRKETAILLAVEVRDRNRQAIEILQ